MKFIDIVQSAGSNMARSKVRTLLTITAIFIGAFTITMTVGISSGVSDYIDKQLSGVGASDVLLIRQKVEVTTDSGPQRYDPESRVSSGQFAFLNAVLTDQDIDAIAQQKGIIEVRPMLLVSPEYIEGINEEKYRIDVQPVVGAVDFELIAGVLPNNESDRSELVLPEAFVSVLGFEDAAEAVNTTLTIAIKTPTEEVRTLPVTIVGIQQLSLLSQGGASVNDILLNTLYDIQTEGVPAEVANKYMGAIARFDATLSEEEVNAIKARLDETGYVGQTVEDRIGIIKQVIDAITYVLLFFGAIALLAASFGIINTLFMSVQERTKEIGLMKAMGMSRSKVFLLFSIEAVLIGFWGSLAGVVAASLAGRGINAVASDSFLKDLPGFDLTVFPLGSLLLIMAVIMGIAFLAGTLPARRAAAQDPIEALRYE